MAFAEEQLRQLGSKLLERHVRTREERGISLSYIEGWHAIAEANRIFGFDGWDRETISADCVWQDSRSAQKACAYTARVRVRVRAGDTIVYRDGSGVGHGTGVTMGAAHESALKEAETDATKRALTTFGNCFGLALYDREKSGVRRTPRKRRPPSVAPARLWVLYGADGDVLSSCEDPRNFCSAFKEVICAASSDIVLNDFWARNNAVLETLRLAMPGLVTPKGLHYVDVLSQCYEHQVKQVKSIREQPSLPKEPMADAPVEKETSQSSVDRSGLTIPTIRRIRDEEHSKSSAV